MQLLSNALYVKDLFLLSHAGATLGKGLNRVMATLLGGILAVGLHGLATQCGHIAEPLLISIFVFLQGNGNQTSISITFRQFNVAMINLTNNMVQSYWCFVS